MSVGGDTSLWSDLIPDRIIPQIIALVLEGWEAFKLEEREAFKKPCRHEHEVPITKRFCCLLRSLKKPRRDLEFRIDWEFSVLDKESGRDVGRIDLTFSHGWNEDVYFALECKRLNVVDSAGTLRSLATAYVRKGMMRFVEGQYAKGLDKGGMLGYVMDGDVPRAVASVGNAISQRRADLKMKNGGIGPSLIRPDDARVRETRHSLNSGRFVLHHVFLAVG
jgi:hypothetical protein